MNKDNLHLKMSRLASHVLDSLIFKNSGYFIDYSNRLDLVIASNCKYQIVFRNENTYFGSYYVLVCKTYFDVEYYNLDRFTIDQNLSLEITKINMILREQSITKVLKYLKELCKK